jgi:RimJ/RimL family protein N-acetyltransferase
MIHFKKVTNDHKVIFDWLQNPHVQEFWDNSQEHKNDIQIFMNGRVETSIYFDGIFSYWIGFYDETPYAFLLTCEITHDQEMPEIWKSNLPTVGKIFSIDFCIGNEDFLSKGLAAPTLVAFTNFFKTKIDIMANTFFIDPDDNNPRARHVYQKAGFNDVGSFIMDKGVFKSNNNRLMIKKMI